MKKIQTNKGAVPVKPIIIIIIIVAIALVVMSLDGGDSANTSTNSEQPQGVEVEKNSEEMSDDEMDGGHNNEMTDDEMKKAPVGDQSGSYEDYSAEKVANAEGRVVLFFHAGWCPTCRGQEKNILDSKADIPSDLTILKVNYDKETELKSKYGVRLQHSFVQVDSQGNALTKWAGGTDLDDVVKNLK